MPLPYSSTPLAKKLGIKEGQTLLIIDAPPYYFELFYILPEGLKQVHRHRKESIDFIHLFVMTRSNLKKQATKCLSSLKKNGSLWISWPKKSSALESEVTRDIIRVHLLALGLVDVKVAAIDEDWSGMKFMYRIVDR